jgi:hypothetical protein
MTTFESRFSLFGVTGCWDSLLTKAIVPRVADGPIVAGGDVTAVSVCSVTTGVGISGHVTLVTRFIPTAIPTIIVFRITTICTDC